MSTYTPLYIGLGGGAAMDGWQWMVSDDIAFFGNSKSGWIWLIYSNHRIALSLFTQLL